MVEAAERINLNQIHVARVSLQYNVYAVIPN